MGDANTQNSADSVNTEPMDLVNPEESEPKTATTLVKVLSEVVKVQ